jgi:transposase
MTESRDNGDKWDRLLGELASAPVEEGWVTLEEAAGSTGVSKSTLRSWYRGNRIPSRMVAGVHGPQRVVPLDAVIGQALSSSRTRRQLEQVLDLRTEINELRQRLERVERHLGLN